MNGSFESAVLLLKRFSKTMGQLTMSITYKQCARVWIPMSVGPYRGRPKPQAYIILWFCFQHTLIFLNDGYASR